MSVNPREGWKSELKGDQDARVLAEMNTVYNLCYSVIRTQDGLFLPKVSDSPRSRRAKILDVAETNKKLTFLGRKVKDDENFSDDDDDDDDDGETKNSYNGELDGNQSITSAADNGSFVSPQIKEENSQIEDNPHRKNALALGVLAHEDLAEAMLEVPQTLDELRIDSLIDFSNEDDESVDSKKEARVMANLQIATQHREAKLKVKEEKSKCIMLNLNSIRIPGRIAQKLNDDTLIDCTQVVKRLGIQNPRQLHNLALRSAYETYCSGGEPVYTTSCPGEAGEVGVRCTDFLFYSGTCFLARRILSIPPLTQLQGESPREILSTQDPYWTSPPRGLCGIYNSHKMFNKAVPPPNPTTDSEGSEAHEQHVSGSGSSNGNKPPTGGPHGHGGGNLSGFAGDSGGVGDRRLYCRCA